MRPRYSTEGRGETAPVGQGGPPVLPTGRLPDRPRERREAAERTRDGASRGWCRAVRRSLAAGVRPSASAGRRRPFRSRHEGASAAGDCEVDRSLRLRHGAGYCGNRPEGAEREAGQGSLARSPEAALAIFSTAADRSRPGLFRNTRPAESWLNYYGLAGIENQAGALAPRHSGPMRETGLEQFDDRCGACSLGDGF